MVFISKKVVLVSPYATCWGDFYFGNSHNGLCAKEKLQTSPKSLEGVYSLNVSILVLVIH